MSGARFLALLGVLAVTVTGCGSSPTSVSSTAALPGGVGAPGSFVSVRYLPGRAGTQALTVSSATTGRILERLLPDPWHGMTIDSTALDAAGRLWVTVSEGPACTSNVAGCGPKPRSCASEVIRLDPGQRNPVVVLRGSSGELITDAAPDPTGTRLAYLTSGCVHSYFDSHIVVDHLATGRSFSVGASLRACHDLRALAWNRSGTALSVDYGPSRLPAHAPGYESEGLCSAWAPDRLAVVDAAPAAGLPGPQATADPGCQIEASAPTATGYAAVEACGGSSYSTGPAVLLTFDAGLQPTGRTPVGACLDGASLAASSDGTRLISSLYLYCNPPGKHSHDVVSVRGTTGAPATIIDETNTDTDTVDDLSW